METTKDQILFNKEVIGRINYPVFGANHRGITEEECRLRMEQLTEKDVAVFDELGSLPAQNIHSEAYASILCLEGRLPAR